MVISEKALGFANISDISETVFSDDPKKGYSHLEIYLLIYSHKSM